MYMVRPYEVFILILSLGALVFARLSRARVQRLPARDMLLASFYLLILATTLSALEGWMWGQIVELLKYGSYTLSLILMAAWCWQAFAKKGSRP